MSQGLKSFMKDQVTVVLIGDSNEKGVRECSRAYGTKELKVLKKLFDSTSTSECQNATSLKEEGFWGLPLR